MAAVEFFRCPTDRSWTRDYCPTFCAQCERAARHPELAVQRLGEIRQCAANDDGVTEALAPRARAADVDPANRQGKRIVLEGGSIDVNGAGAVLTTEECLLSEMQARNPELSRADLEAIFLRISGCDAHAMAAERHRWRRYAWACGRLGAIHGCRARW